MLGENTEYLLTMNRKQAHVLCAALDLYFRVGMGQLEEVLNLWRFRKGYDPEAVQDAIRVLKSACTGMPYNSFLSSGSPDLPQDFKIACDIFQALRQKIAQAEDHDKRSVWNHDPLKQSEEPLPTVQSRLNTQ